MKWGYLGANPEIGAASVLSGDIGPDSVVSGNIGSGAVTGANFSGNHTIASGTVGGFDLGSGIILSVHIADGAVVTVDVGSGAILSGQLGSGQLGGINQFAGTVRFPGILQVSGLVETFAGINAYGGVSVETGALVAKSGITLDGSESGFITNTYIGSGAVQSGAYASGSISAFKFASGILQSGVYLASGSVFGQLAAGPFIVASGTLGSLDLGSGIITNLYLGSGAVQSGVYASGSISQFKLASGVLTSGVYIGSGTILGQAGGGPFHVASGTLNTYNFASGATIMQSQETTPIFNGQPFGGLITEEIISGVRAAAISPSGNLWVAMAAVSGRMPAVGVVYDNVLSGLATTVHSQGFCQSASGLNDYSGYVGRRVWVGRSGQITTISGNWSSGGFASGDLGQIMGIVCNSGGFVVNCDMRLLSGGPLGLLPGPPI